MDFIIVNTADGELTIAVDHISYFYDDVRNLTQIILDSGERVYADGNISKNLREQLRKTKYQIVKIGE